MSRGSVEREREIKPPGMMSADPQCTYGTPATGLGGEGVAAIKSYTATYNIQQHRTRKLNREI